MQLLVMNSGAEKGAEVLNRFFVAGEEEKELKESQEGEHSWPDFELRSEPTI